MYFKSCLSTFLLPLSLLFGPYLQAEEVNMEALMKLSLEEILKLRVTVASVEEETIAQTPAVVSSFYTSSMSTLGLRTLKDILSLMPGVVVDDSTFGNTQVLIRGMTDAYGQKVLFLLDDTPLWMPINASIPLLGFPIELIDHVEVIRGPGAVIYGTNASSGVIKVVTKKNADNKLALVVGSNNKYDAQGYWHTTLASEHRITLSLKMQVDEGYDGFYEKNTGPSKSHNRKEEAQSLYLRYNHEAFEVVSHFFESEFNGSLHLPGPLTRTIDATYHSQLVHLSNGWRTNNSATKAYSDYNIFYYEYPNQDDQFGEGIDAKSIVATPADNYRWRSGVSSNYNWNQDTSFFYGIETETRAISNLLEVNKVSAQETILVAKGSKQEHALFGQIDHHLGSWRFLMGSRFTHNSDYGDKLTPRFSTVYNLSETQSIKLLYSVGLNAPSFFQTSLTADVALGNPELEPELIKMTDLAYTHAASDQLFVANIYYLSAEDFITRIKVNDETSVVNTFANAGGFHYYGGELDYQHKHYQWNGYYNLSYHHQGNRDNDDQVANGTPRWTASIGNSYKIDDSHTLGGSIRYIDERAEIEALTLVNLNYSYFHQDLEFFGTLRNLLDEKAESPDLATFTFKHLPRSDGFNFLLGVRSSF